jgi:DNA-binding response OmpR family regulator
MTTLLGMSARRFTRPQGKKLTGIAKRHPRALSQSVAEERESVPSSRVTRRILVADGNTEAVASTAFALATAAYRVSTVLTADEALATLRRERYDLVVLSATLGGSGIELLRKLRAQARPEVFGTQTEAVGVVMILDESDEDHEAARYLALAHGADDVLARPFTTRELLVRIVAILRRAARAPAVSQNVFRIGELFVDFGGHNVMVEDDMVDLTRREFSLLRALAENAGQLCTREFLAGIGDEMSRATPSRTIDMQISRLRRKLGTAGQMIHSVRGEGYRLARARPALLP